MKTLEQILADSNFTDRLSDIYGYINTDLMDPGAIFSAYDNLQTSFNLQDPQWPQNQDKWASEFRAGLPGTFSGFPHRKRDWGDLRGWAGDWLENWWKKLHNQSDTTQPPQNGQPSAPDYPPTPPSPEGRPYQGRPYQGWKKPKETWW